MHDETVKVIAPLLEAVDAPVAVPAVARFAVRDKFVVGRDGELPIRYIGEDFAAKFGTIVEQGVEAGSLQQHRLVEASIDAPIVEALGGERAADTPLAHLFAFLKSANRSRWYFFYVADPAGTLWAVDTYWRDGGWDMEAYSATYPRGWRGGGHVVARSKVAQAGGQAI